jgi:hypothetical protein
MLEVTRKATYTVTMDDLYATKLTSALGRILNTVSEMDQRANPYVQLVNTGTIDTLLSIKTALIRALEG